MILIPTSSFRFGFCEYIYIYIVLLVPLWQLGFYLDVSNLPFVFLDPSPWDTCFTLAIGNPS